MKEPYTQRWAPSGPERAPRGLHEGIVVDAQLHPVGGLQLMVEMGPAVLCLIRVRQRERAALALKNLGVVTAEFGGRLPSIIGARIRACCDHREFTERGDNRRKPRVVQYCYWTDFELLEAGQSNND